MLKSKKNISIKDQIINSALILAQENPWQTVTMDKIINHSQLSKADIDEYFDCKTDILVGYGRRIDRHLHDNIHFGDDTDLTPREKLFDILMDRFDRVNEDRQAILSILHSFKKDPKQMVISLPHLGKSMARALDLSGITSTGIRGAIHVSGLVGVYLYALKIWMDDDSPDLSKTMAALDKALGFIDRTMQNPLCQRFL